MRRGAVLLSVQADDRDWAAKGKQILEQTGAEDISGTTDTEWEFGNTVRPAAVSSMSRRKQLSPTSE